MVSRRQLLARGTSKEEIDWRIRTGRLHRLHPGVYAVGHRVIPKQGWWMAAVLASGPEAVLSHYSAAMLWGLRSYSERATDVMVPRKSTSTKRIRRHHSGTRKVQAALKEDPHGRKRSPLEERFAPFLRRYRLPLPRFNDWILLGDKRFQVDCHWPNLRQIVEIDGWEGHSTRTAFQEDRARDRRLTAAGFTVTHITWRQLDDEAEEVAADLRSLLLATKPLEPTPPDPRA